ncbi:uncharacterized protein J7T54_002850 [Emericellopsis cladophorae]|uniref:Uncharacterized protein n=1 Tax=Emericellopsis cladophorae TaxID=2686198 RepID=A0A9Q0BDR2_9HYPO|nr:uncharacterized protein J7T54_002850 [Emericellopsis cladophorae]KAI6780454.1 hypothetical protein J7T54_002850 [Emericellopsis cladophorae]
MPTDRDSQRCRASHSEAIADAVVHLDQPAKAPERLNVRFHGANTDRGRKTRPTRDKTIDEEGFDSDDILSLHDALRSPRLSRTGQPAPTAIRHDKASKPLKPRHSFRRSGCWRFLLGVASSVAVAKQDHRCGHGCG